MSLHNQKDIEFCRNYINFSIPNATYSTEFEYLMNFIVLFRRIIRNRLRKAIHPYSTRQKLPYYFTVCLKFYTVTRCFASHSPIVFEIGITKRRLPMHSLLRLENRSFWRYTAVSSTISQRLWNWQRWKQNGNQLWLISSKLNKSALTIGFHFSDSW